MSLTATETLVKQASLLLLAAIDLAEGMKSGNFRSLYRGQGIEFSDVRDYIRGDDVRNIDWNVTARMGKPYIKMFEEERELQVFLVVDSSISMNIASEKISKLNMATYCAAILTIASEINDSPLGAVFFDKNIKFSCAPEFGRERTMIVLTQLDKLAENQEKGSILGGALTGAGKLLRKRSLVFVFSDFRSSGWEKPLITLSQKHDVIAINIKDKLDEELPSLGTVPFEDMESGLTMTLPSSSPKFKKAWKEFDENNTKHMTNTCLKHGILPVIMKTTDDPLTVLNSIFAHKSKLK